jgi:hypothetical protein
MPRTAEGRPVTVAAASAFTEVTVAWARLPNVATVPRTWPFAPVTVFWRWVGVVSRVTWSRAGTSFAVARASGTVRPAVATVCHTSARAPEGTAVAVRRVAPSFVCMAARACSNSGANAERGPKR